MIPINQPTLQTPSKCQTPAKSKGRAVAFSFSQYSQSKFKQQYSSFFRLRFCLVGGFCLRFILLSFTNNADIIIEPPKLEKTSKTISHPPVTNISTEQRPSVQHLNVEHFQGPWLHLLSVQPVPALTGDISIDTSK